MSQNSQTRLPELPAFPDRPLLPDPLGDLDDPAWSVVGFGRDYTGGHHIARHSHGRAQLLFASQGVMRVTTDRGTWVVPPQQAVWVPGGMVHEVAAGGSLAMRSLYVQVEALGGGLPRDCQVVAVSPLLAALIQRAVAFDTAAPPNPAERHILAVLADELRALRPEPLHLPLPQDRRLRAVTERLMAAPADGRPLAAWARQAGASARTLARLFRRETGLTFGAWRQRLRLVTAVARLAEGEAVTTVAYDLGYDSPSAFIAMFRRKLGAPPGRYLRGGGGFFR